MNYITIPDADGETTCIPLDNIAYVAAREGETRIYLRQIATTLSPLGAWYISTSLSVDEVMRRIKLESTNL